MMPPLNKKAQRKDDDSIKRISPETRSKNQKISNDLDPLDDLVNE